jgi:uncharacterized membrane protein YeaQ/YmgE (transglycosylase-associated protein family)
MIAFLIAGLILGVLARTLRGGPDNPQVYLTVPVAVVGAVVGGVGANVVAGNDLTDLTAFSFAMACVVGVVLLGLLEGGVGTKPGDRGGVRDAG